MSFARKVCIAVNLNDPLPEVLHNIKNLDFISHCEVHLVHVYLTSTYALGMGETAIVYPLETDQKKIGEASVNALREMAPSILPKNFDGGIVPQCLFSEDPKRMFCDYVNENHIDMVITAARAKRGIFESSFTNFVAKHTTANMVILKHKE